MSRRSFLGLAAGAAGITLTPAALVFAKETSNLSCGCRCERSAIDNYLTLHNLAFFYLCGYINRLKPIFAIRGFIKMEVK
jgi:hypothetical protein